MGELYGLIVVTPEMITDTSNPGATAVIADLWEGTKCTVFTRGNSSIRSMSALRRFYRTASPLAAADATGPQFMLRSQRDPDAARYRTGYWIAFAEDWQANPRCRVNITGCIS